MPEDELNVKQGTPAMQNSARRKFTILGVSVTGLQLKVLEGLGEFYGANRISKEFNINRRSVYKAIKSLSDQGIVNRDKSLTSTSVEILRKKGTVSNIAMCSSGHSVQLQKCTFKIIPLGLVDWTNRRLSVGTESLKGFKTWATVGGLQQSYFFKDQVTIWTTTKHLFVIVKDVFGATPQEAKEKALEIFFKIVPQLERRYSCTLVKDGVENIKVSANENALNNHELAKYYQERGRQFLLKINGDTRAFSDNSKGLKQLEFPDSRHAEEDATAMQKENWDERDVKDILENPHYTSSEASKLINSLIKASLEDKKADIEVKKSTVAVNTIFKQYMEIQMEKEKRLLQSGTHPSNGHENVSPLNPIEPFSPIAQPGTVPPSRPDYIC